MVFDGTSLAPALQAVALSLLHSLWQGLLAAALLASASVSLRKASTRYAAACLALGGLTLSWGVTIFILWQGRCVPSSSGPHVSESHTALSLLLVTWLIGVCACATHALGGWLRLRAWVRDAQPSSLQALVDRLRQSTGTRQAVRLLESARHGTPLVIGWLKPVILAPPAVLCGLSPEHLEAILRHELAHVRRHDYLVNLLQVLVETLLFYNPFLHWISSRIRMERELCCDFDSIGTERERFVHAEALAALEELRPLSPSLALSAQGGSLMIRIRSLLLSDDTPPPSLAARATFPCLVAVLLASLSLGAMAAQRLNEADVPPRVQHYTSALEEAGARHDVDPRLLGVMMLAESGGDPEAVSSSGALGLMQVMPETARRIAAARGLPVPSESELRDPAVNLDYAAWYLSQQLNRFDDADHELAGQRLAVAAYNAGPNRVAAWLAGKKELPKETRRYEHFISEFMERQETSALRAWRSRAPDEAGSLLVPTSQSGAVHPLDGARLSARFGEQVDPISRLTRFHTGIDLAAGRGTPVKAAFGGTVLSAKREGARGNSVLIQQLGGTQTTRYDHLQGVHVEAGQVLTAGEQLGTVGSTGRSTGPHLHFEIHENGVAIDPATVLP